MKTLRKLKALFFKDSNQVALNLAAAEIKRGRAYLHPIEDPTVTYRVRSDDIEIFLNGNNGFSDDGIKVLRKRDSQKTDKESKDDVAKQNAEKRHRSTTVSTETDDRFKKRKFTVSLYQHEYDTLVGIINTYGYSRADFILASANTATRGTMDREHKKIVKVHKDLRKEEKIIKANQKSVDA